MIKNKTLCLSIASVFALIFLASFASAAVAISSENFNDGDLTGWTVTNWTNAGTYATSSNTDPSTLEKIISTVGYETIVIKYDRQLGDDWETTNKFKASWFNGSAYTTLEEVVGSDSDALPNDASFVSKTYTLPSTANNNAAFKLKFECSTNALNEFCKLDNITVEGTSIVSITVPSEITACTTTGNPDNDLKIKIDDIKVNGYGKDEEWLPLDEISVEINVENDNSDDKIKDIIVGWGLYNADTDEWYIDDEENDFDVKDGDDKTITITFKLDDDIDELADGEYTLYVWANGELNDVELCASDSQEIAMQIESDFVIIDDVKIVDSAECGMDVQISADVWNIGDDEQNEVMVVIQNTELGITKKVTIGDISEFDSEKLDVTIKIPQDADEKSYSFEFMVYNEDGEIYENDFDDDESKLLVPIKIQGGCSVEQTAVVSASLESGGKAGSDLVIKATVTNTGDKSITYTLNAAGYTGWATLASVEPNTLVLNSGESKEVLLNFKVNKDASGEQMFNIEILSGTDLILKQPVSVSIESTGFGGFSLGNNWYLWAIGALNVILVIVIIVIAVRVAKN